MFRQFTIFVGLFLALYLNIFPVMAQDDVIQADTIREVVISGSRPIYNLSSPSPVQVLRSRDLERLNSQSVADAVRYFSGVQIKDYGGIGGLKTVNIRSMGTNHMGVFYDGIQLGNAQNGQVDLGKFSLDNMEAVSLYNGQKSDIFQSARDFGSAGTIYLTSVKPRFSEGENTRLRVTYKTAFYEMVNSPLSYGLTNPSILWQQKLTERIHAVVSAEWLNTNGRYRFEDKVYNNNGSVAYDTLSVRENSDVNAIRAEAGLNGVLDSGEWNVRAYFYDSGRGLPGAAVRNQFSRDQRLWERNFFIQGSFRKQLRERYDFKVNGKYAYDYSHFVDNEAGRLTDNTYNQQEVYLSVINKYDILPFWSISLPVDLQYNKLDADLDNFSYPQRYTLLGALASAWSFEKLKIQASILATAVHETVEKEREDYNHSEWTPAVFASVKPFSGEDFHIRAFYKKVFRMPTFNDLYYTALGENHLKPESAVQYDLGITYGKGFVNHAFRNITFQADAYYNKITDKIIATPTSYFYIWSMENLGIVKILGTDVSAHIMMKLGEVYLKTNLSYTWQQAEDHTSPTEPNYKHQIPYIPRHSGSVTVNAGYRTWGLNYSFIYTGERYSEQENIPVNYLQPWYTSDISMFKEFVFPGVKLKLSAEVNNLLNQYYSVVTNYPMPGRNYRLILSVDF